MTIRRYMGIETEYGIMTTATGTPAGQLTGPANPILLSSLLVHHYHLATGRAGRRPRWDYADEDPLADARGFRLDRASAHPSLLTDDEANPAPSGEDDSGDAGAFKWESTPRFVDGPQSELAAGSSILANGARLYVDHAHPEYSSPEVTSPLDAVRWDRAGEIIMAVSCESSLDGPFPLIAYKNNVDGKGASYGTHENITMNRSVEFADIVRTFTPFLVTRQVFAGAGRVGIGPTSAIPGFQISQRADYIESEVALETTLNRPIINTRDEPHADRATYRRLHLIIGDANCFDVPTYLKLGTISLLAWMLENAASTQVAAALQRIQTLALAQPVVAVQQVSRDLDLSSPLRLADGREFTALQIQQEYLEAMTSATAGSRDPETSDLLARWEQVLTGLATDPESVADQVEWVAKRRILEGKRARAGVGWHHPVIAAMDVQWSDVRPGKGLANALRARGHITELVPAAAVEAAVTTPPSDTRAWLRAQLVQRYFGQVASASWDAVSLDAPGERGLVRIRLVNPEDGTEAATGHLFDQDPDITEFIRRVRA